MEENKKTLKLIKDKLEKEWDRQKTPRTMQSVKYSRALLILGFASIIILPLIYKYDIGWSYARFGDLNSIGSFVGGVTTPFISVIAAWLVFKAFSVANQNSI